LYWPQRGKTFLGERFLSGKGLLDKGRIPADNQLTAGIVSAWDE
jgi:hypothetical protein